MQEASEKNLQNGKSFLRETRIIESDVPQAELSPDALAGDGPDAAPSSGDLYRAWIRKACQALDEAAHGNLEARLLGCPDDPDIRQLCRSVNHYLDITDAFVRESAASLTHAAEGKFYRRFLYRGLLGSFRKAAEVINAGTDAMKSKDAALADANRRRLALADELENVVHSVVAALASSATELTASADALSVASTHTTEQAKVVTSASEQSAAGINTIAAATEELSSSVVEINRQVQESSRIAGTAVQEADRSREIMDKLATASKKIGGVVKLITQIANQTNLLALNATIEAARAGDAGRGFAVVASEVKNLARQTSEATEGITEEITSIQGASTEAVAAISGVSSTINRMNDISSAVSVSISEQRGATAEISKTVQQAAVAAQEVTRSMSTVSAAAVDANAAVTQVLAATRDLSKQAESLKSQVEKFLHEIRHG